MKSSKWFNQEESIIVIKTRTICENKKLEKDGAEYLEVRDFLLPVNQKLIWARRLFFWTINVVSLVSGILSIANIIY